MAGFDCIIVGGGHGGAQAAAALRQEGYEGTIAIIGAEQELPYDRPSLSKDYILGKKSADALRLRSAEFWTAQRIELRLGERVICVNPTDRTVFTDSGAALSYETLVWSAGGTPRRLGCPGEGLSGIHYIRLKSDVDALIGEVQAARRATIVGGGYIGLEAAAALRQLGVDVTVIEASDRLLARVAGHAISSFYLDRHRDQGVEFLFGRTVAEIAGDGSRATHLVLDNGETLETDIIIIGIGILPEASPLLDAGCHGDGAVLVDHLCRTSIARIYCIGDCARMADVYPVRLESIQNANDQAKTAARSICGKPTPHNAVPWFWSNQYDLRLQTVGLSVGHDDAVVRGNPAENCFSVVYLKAGTVVALDCVNSARDYVQGRRLVEGGLAVPRDLLADVSCALKDMLSVTASRSGGPAAMELSEQ